MSARSVPIWAMLPRSAPEPHQRAWERAWSRIQAPRSSLNPGASSTVAPLVGEMLQHLVEDPEAPPELIGEAVTAHVTEGRGAPDGVSPRGRLLLACLRRGLWRPAWLPASLVALQEADRDLDEDERVDLTRRLLSGHRLDARLRPLALALCVLGRPHRPREQLERILRSVLTGPDVDADTRERILDLLSRPGWFVVRPDSLKDHPEFDEYTRNSLRRTRPFQLLISQSCVRAVDAVRRAPPPPPTSSRPPRRVTLAAVPRSTEDRPEGSKARPKGSKPRPKGSKPRSKGGKPRPKGATPRTADPVDDEQPGTPARQGPAPSGEQPGLFDRDS